jgi:hypothetical protein
MKQSDCCKIRDDSRTLVLSQRYWNRQFYMPLIYEFEDVIAAVDRADLLTPDLPWLNSRIGHLVYDGANYARSRLSLGPSPGIPGIKIERDYELFFCILTFGYETAYLKQLEHLRRRCKRCVCMFVELWTSQMRQFRRSLKVLEDLEFDYIFLHHSTGLPALRALLRTPSIYLPLGVDCLRFTPHPQFPARSIDCYSMGRRSAVTHASLLELAAQKDFFYLYDTVARFPLIDWKEHRSLTARLTARTRYLTSYKPALRKDVEVGSDEMIGARSFEGAAGGAVMIGVPPDCQDYRDCFPWPDATIEIPFECWNMASVIADLEADPERIARLRRSNMVQSLLRHDWIYRWELILQTLNMEATPAMTAREDKLRAIAAEVQGKDLSPERGRQELIYTDR